MHQCLRFQSARVDKTRPIEDTIKILSQLVKEGKFDHIGLSEVSAATLRRAHAVSLPLLVYYLTETRIRSTLSQW